jgi:hypothetical protein
MTASCQALFDAGTRLRLVQDQPAAGAVFLIWRPEYRHFGHTGFIVEKVAGVWTTIEGNTNPQGGREGYGVFKRTRTFAPQDRFIHWLNASTS